MRDEITRRARRAREAAEPHLRRAKDAASPHVEQARQAAAPHVEQARQAAAPHVQRAQETLTPHAQATARAARHGAGVVGRATADFTVGDRTWEAAWESGATPLVPRPPAMVWAVRLMLVGAVMELVTALPVVFSQGKFARRAHTVMDEVGGVANSRLANALLDGYTAVVITAAIFWAVVWLLLAVVNRRGYRWARWVGTALAALNLGMVWVTVWNIPSVVLGIATTVLLWLPASSAFYRRNHLVRRGR